MTDETKKVLEELQDVIGALKNPELTTNKEYRDRWRKKWSSVSKKIEELSEEENHALKDAYAEWFKKLE